MGIVSLAELVRDLKNKNVYVPLYQRNYKWSNSKTEKNGSGRLIKDILERVYPENGKQKDFVLGMITVYEPEEGSIEILDGQQRMITLSLIMKALGKIKDDWFDLQFARDSKNEMESRPRHDFLYIDNCDENSEDVASVDVARMKKNYIAIKEVLKEKIDRLKLENSKSESDIKDDVMKYMGAHIKVFLHTTNREPIDEFLNMNFNKTPFCASDYIKSYMILDAADKEKQILVTVDKVMKLWKEIQEVLYQLKALTVAKENSIENEMFELIKKGYYHTDKNRMEVLFEHKKRYYENNKVKAERYYEKADSLNEEYKILRRYYDIMKQLLEELIVKDKDGIRHPNYTAYSAYNLLHSKEPTLKFFELFDNDTMVQQILYSYSKFNLTEESYNRLDKTQEQNISQFMEAMLVTKSTTEQEKQESIIGEPTSGLENFSQYQSLFDESFQEFVVMMESGKKEGASKEEVETLAEGNNVWHSIDSKGEIDVALGLDETYTLKELFANEKIKKIVIPQLQRDYVMGSEIDYLKKYLCRIRYEEICAKHKSKVVPCKETEEIPLGRIKDKEVCASAGKLLELFWEKVLSSQEEFWDGTELKVVDPKNEGRKERYTIAREYAKFLGVEGVPEKVNNFRAYTEQPLAGVLKMKNKVACYWNEYMKALEEVEVNEYSVKMNSSCIMGHLDSEGTFWVYDGQQRITTAVVLLAYLLRNEKNEHEIKKYLKKFFFEERDGANAILTTIINNPPNEIRELRGLIEDQTGFSLYSFWELLNNDKTKSELEEIRQIAPSFLWAGMDFELVLMKEISEAEQMFIEMNEGVKLTEEEKYKAQLCHLMRKLQYENQDEFIRSMDNKWLDAFKEDNECERKEMKWLQYCITMSYWEKNGYGSRDETSLEGINKEILDLAYSIMNEHFGERKDRNISQLSPLDKILLWSDTVKCNGTPSYYCAKSEKIYFNQNDFKDFIEKLYKFCGETLCYETFFQCIKTMRESKSVELSMYNEETEPGKEVVKKLLETRKNWYEFQNVKQWEDNETKYSFDFSERCFKLDKIAEEVEDSTPSFNLTLEDSSELALSNIYMKMSQDGIDKQLNRYYCKKEKSFKVSVAQELIQAMVLSEPELNQLYQKKNRDIWNIAEVKDNSAYKIKPNGELADILKNKIKELIKKEYPQNLILEEKEFCLEHWMNWIKDSLNNHSLNDTVKKNYTKAILGFVIKKGIGYVNEAEEIAYVNGLSGVLKDLCDACNRLQIVKETMNELKLEIQEKNKILREVASSTRSFEIKKIGNVLLEMYKVAEESVQEKIADYIVRYYEKTADDECFTFMIWYLRRKGTNYDDKLNYKTAELIEKVVPNAKPKDELLRNESLISGMKKFLKGDITGGECRN